MVYTARPRPRPSQEDNGASGARPDWFRYMTAYKTVVGGAGQGGGGGECKPEASLPLIPLAVPAVHACCNSRRAQCALQCTAAHFHSSAVQCLAAYPVCGPKLHSVPLAAYPEIFGLVAQPVRMCRDAAHLAHIIRNSDCGAFIIIHETTLMCPLLHCGALWCTAQTNLLFMCAQTSKVTSWASAFEASGLRNVLHVCRKCFAMLKQGRKICHAAIRKS